MVQKTGLLLSQTVEVQGWTQEIPEVNGVFNALSALQIEEHNRASKLLSELSETTDGRRRGEIRRHYNTICKNIERNNQVLNALARQENWKRLRRPRNLQKRAATPKAAKPKAEKKARPTPSEVKKAAANRKPRARAGSRRATLESKSFKELSNGPRSETLAHRVLKKRLLIESSTMAKIEHCAQG